jgi:alkanesulfonate monooxygenase SsuD/methylene tetrahydromethanopterin reductase-like flavin-dependent oxidoreductase (luciferase family)
MRAVEGPFMGYQVKMSRLRSDSTGGSVPNSFDRSILKLREFSEYFSEGWMAIGTPDEVREALQQHCAKLGYRRLMLLMALPGLETDLALRSMRLFAEQLAPAMRAVAAGA